jgi:UrcA family protein
MAANAPRPISEDQMNRFNRLAVAFSVLTLAAVAGVARAEDQHIQVGDLAQADQLAAFNHSLAKATVNLCGTRWDHMTDRNAYYACVAGVRDEAVSQLSPVQRQQLASAGAVRVASR